MAATTSRARSPSASTAPEAGKGEVFYALLAERRGFSRSSMLMLMPNALLSNLQSIRIFPGETVQPWHTDDAFYPVPRPHPPLAVSVIWRARGLRRGRTARPSSSRRATSGAATAPMTAPQAVIRAASAAGSRHRLRRFDVASRRGQPFPADASWLEPAVLPAVSFGRRSLSSLIAPPDVARRCSERGRSLLGYNIHPPFVGQVGGMHPLRLVDPGLSLAEDRRAREIAELVLERPVATMK